MSRSFNVLAVLVVAALAGCDAQTTRSGEAGDVGPRPALASSAPPSSAPASESIGTRERSDRSAEIQFASENPVTYQVRQIVTLDQIQTGAKNVRMWVSIPDDEPNQKILDLNVKSAPGTWHIVHDVEHRARFLKVDVEEPKEASMDVELEFKVARKPVFVRVNPATSGPLSEALKQAYAAELAIDAPHMEVTDKIRAIANEVCGTETNLATQASLLIDYVARSADHYSYSKDPNMPNCGVGDAAICLKQGGGCCTDMHSLFIALARARGIPARLAMGYRLQEKNVGKLIDPGYRCWVEFFIPNYGWISSDIVEADTPTGLGPLRWKTGLTARRVWLNQGREFKLADDLAVGRVNHMSIAYAEIDGVPARLLPEGKFKPQITRKVLFTEGDSLPKS